MNLYIDLIKKILYQNYQNLKKLYQINNKIMNKMIQIIKFYIFLSILVSYEKVMLSKY